MKIIQKHTIFVPCQRLVIDLVMFFMNNVVMNTHHISLVPARLAFLLLLHKGIPAAIDLLELIYRPYNWYVIHVDSRAHAVREELYHTLKQVFRAANNIIVLPEQRSFPTSWASYEIVRAELEGFEELLRQGIWDFVINLSGADYPLRDVDDLAAALAPYRGLNFLPFAQWRKMNDSMDDSNLLKKAFYACDGYVYNIKTLQELPKPDDLKIYNSPQWGVFSRDFVSYLVNGTARTGNLNKYQFYLQTHVVPDESYIPTLLMNSKFKSTARTSFVHTSKEFASDNINNLCRHSNDADFCGQGPAIYELSDVPDLLSASHRSFFARKFHTDLADKTRGVVRDLSQGGYYKFFQHHLQHQIVKSLAENAISVLSNETFVSSLKLENILQLRVLPSLVPHHPCCQSHFLLHFRKIIDYVFWLDFSFANTDNGEVKDARVVLEPSLNGRTCYPDGHLKMAFATTWVRDIQDSPNDEQPAKVGLDQTLPLPFGPAYVSDISVILFFSRDEEDTPNCFSETNDGIPLKFSDSGTDSLNPVVVLLQLVAPDQSIRCIHTETISWDFKNMDEQESLHLIHPITINCGIMQPGPWQILLSQVNVSSGRIYNFPFYLLDYFNEENLNQQLTDVKHLWKVKSTSILFNGNPYTKASTQRKLNMNKNVFFRRKSYDINISKRNSSKFVAPYGVAMHISKTIGLHKIPQNYYGTTEYRKASTSFTRRVLQISGIAIICPLVTLTVKCMSYRRRMFRTRLLVALILLAMTTFIQIILFF